MARQKKDGLLVRCRKNTDLWVLRPKDHKKAPRTAQVKKMMGCGLTPGKRNAGKKQRYQIAKFEDIFIPLQLMSRLESNGMA